MQIMSRNVDVRGTNVAAVRALFSQNDATSTIHKPKLAPKPVQPPLRVSPSPSKSPVPESTPPSPSVHAPPAKLRQKSFTSIEHLKAKFQSTQDPPERVKTPNGSELPKIIVLNEPNAEEPKKNCLPQPPIKTNSKDENDRVDSTENSNLEENLTLPIAPEPNKTLQVNSSQLANIIDRQSMRNPPESRWYANIMAIENLNAMKLPMAPPTPLTTSNASSDEPIFMFGTSVWRKKPLPSLSTIGQLPPPKPQRPSFVTAVARGAWADIAAPQLPERKPFPGTNNSGLGINTRKGSCDPPPDFEEIVNSFITPTTSSNEELYDDTASIVPPPPPRPDRLRSFPAETEELYDDTSVQRTEDGEIYEDISHESETAHYVNGDFSRKSKSLFKLRRDSKDKDKKQKDPDKLKKKFHLTGKEVVVETGIIKETLKNKKQDFSVRKGERIRILRMSNNPAGKWLVINENGELGYVELSNIEVDANSVKSVMFQSSTLHTITRPVPQVNNLYQIDDMEAIYEEFH